MVEAGDVAVQVLALGRLGEAGEERDDLIDVVLHGQVPVPGRGAPEARFAVALGAALGAVGHGPERAQRIGRARVVAQSRIGDDGTALRGSDPVRSGARFE